LNAQFKLSGIILLLVVGLISCDDANFDREEIERHTHDSIGHAAQLKADSIITAEQVARQKILDSFYKTPAGKKEIAEKEKTQRIAELKVRKERDKEYREYGYIITKYGCTKEEAFALKNHKIWLGMTIEMVKFERGLPNSVNVSNYGNGNEYQACWEDYTPSCFYFYSDHVIYAYN